MNRCGAAGGEEPLARIRELLGSQHLGVLATDDSGRPYTSLIAFAVTADLRRILFATARRSRKFSNLSANPRAAILVDDRAGSDLLAPRALSARGALVELSGEDRRAAETLLLARHAQLAAMLADPATAILALEVQVFQLVARFSQVEEIRPGPGAGEGMAREEASA